VSFTKRTIDTAFRSEGIAAADVNKDGTLDLFAGDAWYEGPTWTRHEVAPLQTLDPSTQYSDAFIVFAHDVNADGWVDEIVFGFPGAAAYWRENPKGAAGEWTKHTVFGAASNESPAFAPLEAGKPVLIFQSTGARMAWFEPTTAEPWTEHLINDPVAGAQALPAHGLGTGDLDGDGLADVLDPKGWWRAPDWKWNPADLGPDCAQMFVLDVNGDGRNDVVSTSAHDYGVWWYEQSAAGAFTQHSIDATFSQSHSARMGDINGDGVPDLVTGKRLWAHGPTGDVDPNGPRVLVWYQLERTGAGPRWLKQPIDDQSGVGTQFELIDLDGDGRLDIAVSNKTGVHLFIQD
jgi:hypothetical protein